MKGLVNAGQTCYLNAALQCLAYCPNMTNYFLAGFAENDVCVKKKLASTLALAYSKFVQDYWTTETDQAVDSADVYTAFRKACRSFTPTQQHDAHEAVVCILDRLHEGLGRLKPGNLAVCQSPQVRSKPWMDSLKGTCSVVSEVFRGQMETHVEASGYSNTLFDHFTCLSLAVNESSSVNLSFKRHMAPEQVSNFKVNGTEVDACLIKRFTYLPRILVIHLKRFDGKEKIDKFVDYPVELDLSEYAMQGGQHHYQLFSICLHHGTADQGHYTACCEVKNRWYRMDDEAVVHLKDINDIIQRDAYILFYKRLE